MIEQTIPSDVKTLRGSLPDEPGVYMMRDARKEVLYIGKAKSLRSRVTSYFQDSAAHAHKVRSMLSQAESISYIVTESETEALILESNLVKRRKPRYNVVLRDDKHFPYLRLSVEEEYPKLTVVRRISRGKSLYYGPYVSAKAMRKTLRFLYKVFPIRQCRIKIDGKAERPCLDYHMDLCSAPCIGAIGKEEYGKIVRDLSLFLQGRNTELVTHLREKMERASEGLRFEEAARIRDQIEAIEKVVERQKIISTGMEDQDIIATQRIGPLCNVQLFFVRQGRVLGNKEFTIETEDDDDELLAAFLQQYYSDDNYIPREIVIERSVAGQELLQRWLTEKKGSSVGITVPQRGMKNKWIAMARRNAQLSLQRNVNRQQWREEALGEAQQVLGLSGPPSRIEAFDISNIHGEAAVGSMVVFAGGEAKKSEYRKFRIKTVEGIDDYAMMYEVVHRRLKRLQREELKLPDLMLIDGGKGHLNAALKAMADLSVTGPEVIGLAKGRSRNGGKSDPLSPRVDHVFLPGEEEALLLPHYSKVKHLLQRIRDESHRFALTYHRKVRGKAGLGSILDEVPGIGEKRKASLLKHFGSLQRIREAPVEELMAVPSISRKVAQDLKAHLGP